MDGDSKAKDFIVFHNKRKVINLCKTLLIFLKDIQENDEPISDESYQKIRKRILDNGNDSIREFEESLESFDIRFK